MTEETTPTVYVAEFTDGPLEGTTDTRTLIGGEAEKRIGMVAAVDGLESLFWYTLVETREVQDEIHATFTFDAGDSDSAVSDPESESI